MLQPVSSANNIYILLQLVITLSMQKTSTIHPENVSWEPLTQYSANYKTATITQPSTHLLIIKNSTTNKLFVSVMMMFALLTVGFRLDFFSFENLHSINAIAVAIAILVTVFAVFLLVKSVNAPSKFDKVNNRFSKGGFSIVNRSLDNIVAVQLIEKYTSRSVGRGPGKLPMSGGYGSKELNVVLKNTERINISTSSNKNDALQLAQFLQIPLWEM